MRCICFDIAMVNLYHVSMIYSIDVYGAMVSVGDLEYVGEPGGPMIPKMRFSLVNLGWVKVIL